MSTNNVTASPPHGFYNSIVRSRRTIRVLDLNAALREHQELTGNLRTISLDDGISYYALSYVWGSVSTEPDSISIDGTRIQITENCKDALLSIRPRFGRVTLWIDALCIDQSNDEEKAHQIALMQEIYSKSDKVMVWLGKQNPAAEQAMHWISEASKFRFFCIFPRIAFGPRQLLRAALFELPRNLVWCMQCRLRSFYSKNDVIFYQTRFLSNHCRLFSPSGYIKPHALSVTPRILS